MAQPRKLALLIGVSDYGDGFERLSAPPQDVAALQRVLENPELGGFDQVNTLLNPEPTEMRLQIEALFTGSTRDDLILLFFSGHGITDDSYKLYLTSRLSSKTAFRSTSVDARFIQDLSDGTRAKRQVIILDCCYSGAFAEGWRRKGDVKLELRQELGQEGRVVLTSSSSTQVSFEQEDADLSLYTQYLVEGIETGAADGDRDGFVAIRELHAYAKRKVQDVKPKMKPDIIVVGDEGYGILLSRVKLDAALQFRKWVEACVDHEQGEILDIDQETLQSRAQRLSLPTDQAYAIIASVLEPSRRRLRSLNRYRQKYAEYVERLYPLSPRILGRLREWQQEVLGLEDQDVAPIQQAINREQDRKLAAERATASRVQVDDEKPPVAKVETPAPIKEPSKPAQFAQPPNNKPALDTFHFEVATIKVQKTGGLFGMGGQVSCDIKHESRTARFFAEALGNGVTLEMVQVPGGTFVMGAPATEAESLDRERPQHPVTVPPFLMGKFPVTQAQYQAVMGNNPATQFDGDRFVAPNKPVVGVSWNDAIAFCQRLSQQTGKSYRLPSEAEWEYACRAGTKTPFHFGDTITTDLANYDGNSTYGLAPKGTHRKQTTPVGSFSANAFGLFDLHGNVWEWCLDHWHDNYEGAPVDGSAWLTAGQNAGRLLRGGSWAGNPRYCRSAARAHGTPGYQYNYIGFRVVCVSSWTL